MSAFPTATRHKAWVYYLRQIIVNSELWSKGPKNKAEVRDALQRIARYAIGRWGEQLFINYRNAKRETIESFEGITNYHIHTLLEYKLTDEAVRSIANALRNDTTSLINLLLPNTNVNRNVRFIELIDLWIEANFNRAFEEVWTLVFPDLRKKGISEDDPEFSNHALSEGRGIVKKIDLNGMKISIEVLSGTNRTGVNKKTGEKWEQKVSAHYGYILGTNSPDGEHLDCWVKTNPSKNAKAYVVHQLIPDGSKYDEDKVMLGFNSAEEAKKCFLKHVFKPKMFGGMTEMTIDHLKTAAYQASNSKIILTDEDTYDKMVEKGLIPKSIRNPVQLAQKLQEDTLMNINEYNSDPDKFLMASQALVLGKKWKTIKDGKDENEKAKIKNEITALVKKAGFNTFNDLYQNAKEVMNGGNRATSAEYARYVLNTISAYEKASDENLKSASDLLATDHNKDELINRVSELRDEIKEFGKEFDIHTVEELKAFASNKINLIRQGINSSTESKTVKGKVMENKSKNESIGLIESNTLKQLSGIPLTEMTMAVPVPSVKLGEIPSPTVRSITNSMINAFADKSVNEDIDRLNKAAWLLGKAFHKNPNADIAQVMEHILTKKLNNPGWASKMASHIHESTGMSLDEFASSSRSSLEDDFSEKAHNWVKNRVDDLYPAHIKNKAIAFGRAWNEWKKNHGETPESVMQEVSTDIDNYEGSSMSDFQKKKILIRLNESNKQLTKLLELFPNFSILLKNGEFDEDESFQEVYNLFLHNVEKVSKTFPGFYKAS